VNLNIINRGQKSFSPRSRMVLGIDLGGKIRRGSIILQGPIVVSGGTTSGTAVGDGGPLNLIQHVYIRATPDAGSRYVGGNLVDADSRDLITNAIWQRSGKKYINLRGGTLGGGAAATYQVYLEIPIYWADASQKNGVATALNTDPGSYKSLQLELLTGDLAACFPGNDRTVDWSGLLVQWKDDRVALGYDTLELFQENHRLQIPATNKRMLDPAMPQDGSFMSWQFTSEVNTALALGDTLLNRVVIDGTTIKFDCFADDIRQAMIDDEWLDPSQDGTGMHLVDFTDGVVQANSVPAATFNSYLDVNNVSGANLDTISVFTRRVFAPAPAKAA